MRVLITRRPSKLFLAAALLSLGLVIARSASATWLEASSDHFIIYSDLNEKLLRDFASNLERFDKGLRELFMGDVPEDEGRRSNRLRVYIVPGAGIIKKLCGPKCPKDVAGLYVPRAGRSVAFTPRSIEGGIQVDKAAEWILLHEYTHHFMYSNFTAAYPAWYSEGFAELGSTAKFEKDGSLGFGLPARHRAYNLLYGKTLDVETLLGSTVSRRDPSVTEAVYARGWLLTHYLFFNSDRRKQLQVYLDAINRGTPNIDAAKAAFGDLQVLNRELDQYLSAAKMKYILVPADKLSIGKIDIRPLSSGAAAMMPIQIRSSPRVKREDALALLPEARRLAAPYPEDPHVQLQLAEVEANAGNRVEAEAAIDRALKRDPESMTALLYKGSILLNRAVATKETDEKAWKSVRSWFAKANRADPDAPEPLYLFYDSFIFQGIPPTANAVLGLNRAFELAPEDYDLRFRVARQALVDHQPKLARSALAPMAFNPHRSADYGIFAEVVELLDAGKNDEALQKLTSQKEQKEDGGD